MTLTIFEQVQQIASDLFAVPTDRITAETSPDNLESWDSIQHLNLVLALEEKFNLQLSPEEMEQMRSIGQITTLLATRLQNTPS